MQTNNYSIEKLTEILEAAGCTVRESNSRLFVNSTPNGGRGQYGYLIAGDDGSTGTCDSITKRKGEISAIIRAAK